MLKTLWSRDFAEAVVMYGLIVAVRFSPTGLFVIPLTIVAGRLAYVYAVRSTNRDFRGAP